MTQGQWEAVMGNNPSRFKGASRPVERVSWHDATKFCQKLSQINRTFALPIALRLVARRISWVISNLVASVLLSIIVGGFWHLPIAIA